MNWKVLIGGLVLVVPLLAVLAIGFRFDPRELDTPLVGKPAPDFSLPLVEGGGDLQFSSLAGKPVVLNFWATWCVPCQQEHRELVAAARRLEGKVNFLSVVYQDEPAKIIAWLDRFGKAYPTVIDQGSRAAIAYGVYGVPETYVIDKNGVITYKFVGPVTIDQVFEQVAPLLGNP